MDAIDQKMQRRIFSIERHILLDHLGDKAGLGQLLEAVNNGSFQCDHRSNSVPIVSIWNH
ncbi:hypothetical protein D3C76_1687260 [compost metagenome]